jgi:hypothetical protein
VRAARTFPRSTNVDAAKLAKAGVHYGDEYEETGIPGYGSDATMKLSDFTVWPHMDADYFPTASADNMRGAAKVKEPLYAFDDDTAIKCARQNSRPTIGR